MPLITPDETALLAARTAGQAAAARHVLITLLARAARDSADPERFVMTAVAPVIEASSGEADDALSETMFRAMHETAEQIEDTALSLLQT